MLKRFFIENFSSFRDKNCLDLTAGKSDLKQNHIQSFKNVKVLKNAIVYGANASGKSNLIKALDYAKEIILKDLDDVDTYKKHFRLNEENINKETVFEFELEIDDRFFSYGFNLLLNKKEITEEWLYEIGVKTPKRIFERKENNIELGMTLKKSKNSDRFKIYAEDMENQKNRLFLSELSNKKLSFDEIRIINSIYKWFDEKLIILYPSSEFGAKHLIHKDKSLSEDFLKYLKIFDTGIESISSINENFEEIKDIPNQIKKEIQNDLSNDENSIIVINGFNDNLYTISISKDEKSEIVVEKLGLLHNEDKKEIFELKDESDGTRRLFDLIPLIQKFSDDYTIIIDEFDRSLHPNLTREFFKLFYSLSKKAQLIVTTHESTLLDLNLTRKDEIFLVEKDLKGASTIFPLNKFAIRCDKKIDRAYLLGRYGAVPIFKNLDEKIDEDL